MKGHVTQFIAIIGIGLSLRLFLREAPSPTSPSFTIQSPTHGAVINSPVMVQVEVRGARIGQPIEGLDHLHLSVDGGSAIAIYRNGFLRLSLDPGKHTLFVELAGPTHEGLLRPKSVTFTVR